MLAKEGESPVVTNKIDSVRVDESRKLEDRLQTLNTSQDR